MPTNSAVCPRCGAQVPIAENTASGAEVRCPECSNVFVPPSDEASDYHDAVGAAGGSRDYSLDLGRIFSRGWSGFSRGMGMLIGVTVVGFLLTCLWARSDSC
jgi:predicted Zn finger-like uncharacterized protein